MVEAEDVSEKVVMEDEDSDETETATDEGETEDQADRRRESSAIIVSC